MTTRTIRLPLQFLSLCLILLASFNLHAQSPAARTGRFIHGTGTNAAYQIFVVTLDDELGVTNAPTGPVSTFEAANGTANIYEIDGTNTLEQTNISHRILVTNAAAVFGYWSRPISATASWSPMLPRCSEAAMVAVRCMWVRPITSGPLRATPQATAAMPF